jgi:SPP1 family predicted phage head-tail adaptor
MQAGMLNRRIAIQSQSTAQDAAGGLIPSWSTLYACWASIDVQNSQLLYATAEFVSKTTYRITLRWTSSVIVSAKQRVIYTEPTTGVVHTYEVQSVVNEKAANRQIMLLCYELAGQE